MTECCHSQIYQVLAPKYQPEIHLLEETGKLTLDDGWDNVVDHSLIQAEVHQILADWLRLPQANRNSLVTVAIWHDWRKRIDRKPEDFSSNDRLRAEQVLNTINPDPNLMSATGPEFLERVLLGKSTFLERLQFYVDDISKGSEIVAINKRIDEVEVRRLDLNEDTQLTERLGRKYWDVERLIGRVTEQTIVDLLKINGFKVKKPTELPLLLKEELIKRGIPQNCRL